MSRRKPKAGPPKVGGARAGAGRPATDAPKRNQQVMLRLTAAEKSAAKAAADAEKRPISDWYRAAAKLAITRGSTQ